MKIAKKNNKNLRTNKKGRLWKKVPNRRRFKKEAWANKGAIYIGNLPHGFYEDGLKGFFSQFGSINRIKVVRSKKNANPVGYAFIEFTYGEVAKVAAETMNGYFLFDKVLKCRFIEGIHSSDKLFADSDLKPETCKGTLNKIANQQELSAVKNPEKAKEEQEKRLRKAEKLLRDHLDIDAEVDLSGCKVEVPSNKIDNVVPSILNVKKNIKKSPKESQIKSSKSTVFEVPDGDKTLSTFIEKSTKSKGKKNVISSKEAKISNKTDRIPLENFLDKRGPEGDQVKLENISDKCGKTETTLLKNQPKSGSRKNNSKYELNLMTSGWQVVEIHEASSNAKIADEFNQQKLKQSKLRHKKWSSEVTARKEITSKKKLDPGMKKPTKRHTQKKESKSVVKNRNLKDISSGARKKREEKIKATSKPNIINSKLSKKNTKSTSKVLSVPKSSIGQKKQNKMISKPKRLKK